MAAQLHRGGSARCREAAARLWCTLAPAASPAGPARTAATAARRPRLGAARAVGSAAAPAPAGQPVQAFVPQAAAPVVQPPPPQQQQQQQQQQQPAPPPHPPAQPQQPAAAPAVDPALRQRYAYTRMLAALPQLVPPSRPGELSPAATRWLVGALRLPPALLAAAGVGMASVQHPLTRETVAAVALPYRDAGRVVDVRYWTLADDGAGGAAPEHSWLGHGGWPLYALDAAAVLSAAGDVVVAGDELEVLALAAAGVRAAFAVPQQQPSWAADTPAYGDERARAQPLRDRIEALRKAAEAAASADERNSRASLAASLGLGSGGGGAAAGAGPAPAAGQQPQQQQQRKRGRARRGAGGAATQSGMALLLPNAESAVLALDASREAESLASELAGLLGTARCRGVSWPRGWDEHPEGEGAASERQAAAAAAEAGDDGARSGVLEVYSRDGPDALLLYLNRAYTWPVEGIERFGDCGGLLLAAFEGQLEQQQAHSTGWHSVDELFRVTPGELTLVTGVPNSGKSEWLDALAVNLAERHGWRFALCSLEKRPRDHARQLVEKRAGKPMLRAAYAGDTPRMSHEELAVAFDWLDRHFVVIHSSDDAMPSLDWVLEKARAAVVKFGVRGLVLDPYNELDHSRPQGKNEHEYISEFMARLRQFAKSNGVHVFLVAHPKQRANWRGEAPNLMDISGGANFFAKCDNGIVVHRDWSQLRELKDGGPRRRRGGEGAAGAAGQQQQPDGGGGQAQEPGAPRQPEGQPFLGFKVEIQIQKVRNKTTGSRGVAMLEYDPASGRYFELGCAPASAASAGGGAGGLAAGAAAAAAAGERRNLAREGAGVDVMDEEEGEEEEEGGGGVDDALFEARLRQDAAVEVKLRAAGVVDLTESRERAAAATGEADPDSWLVERPEER
ncbi:hypothetical protein Rsub_01245 [Raphidocelis subcapitata]|uniref:SF4 helicase domain-containing protein n=1 Tax=Raphidocelis subcapitata TaxID=307507 RepID=A0A2V0NSI1_9CHLO|nr:hypothetical protein Rsub_01245 [Raphidocelis subcapitata]|eukprot:GBF88530.1 hypothetical protein Rsub_01245 [Raphidocelis subcapitata]